jgi:chromosome segregation ATPase
MRSERCLLAVAILLALPAMTLAQAPPKKAKKVWTNDDLEALRQRSPLSEFSTTAAAAPPAGGEAAVTERQPPSESQLLAEKVSKRIAGLREELATVESELASLRRASTSGATTGQGVSINVVPGGMNTQDKIQALEQKRRELQSQLSDAEDEARRMGFSPGELRTLPAAAEPPSGLTSEEDAKKAVERMRARMAGLRADLQRVEEDLARLRNAVRSGGTVPMGTVLAPGAPGNTTEDQIRGLEQKRRDLQRQIDELEDEARRLNLRL